MKKTASQISDEIIQKLAREYVARAGSTAPVIPERAALDTATQGNVAMNRAIQQAAPGAPHVNIPQSPATATAGKGMLSGLAGKFKKLPTLGKAGIIGGAALGAYGLGKHFFGGNDQPKQQYGAW